MPRSIEISASAERVDALLPRIRAVEGVIGVSRQRDVGVDPPGDLLSIRATNGGCRSVLRVLDESDLEESDSVVTSEPRSIVSGAHQDELAGEGNETVWEEMAFMLRRNTNAEPNFLTLMTLAGMIGAVGIWTGQVYVVVAAMIVAPAFEALTRLPFGLIVGPRELAGRGLQSCALGYTLMAAGAAAAYFALLLLDPGGVPDLDASPLARYWTTFTATGAALAVLGGTAGATIVAAQRPVLSTGVQIAVALIPSLTVAGMALAAGELGLAGRGLARWLVEVFLIVGSNALFILVKQHVLHRRRSIG